MSLPPRSGRRRCPATLLAIGAAALSFSAGAASAQSATLAMTADRTRVGVGESVNLQVRADVSGANADGLELPDLSAFRVVSRRVARPMQFSFGFGNQQRVLTSSIVYDITLQPTAPGRVDLSPAKIQVGGRSYESNPLTIEVVGGPGLPTDPQMPPPGGSAPPAGPLDGAVFDPQAFLRTIVDEPRPVVGAQMTVTVYLYTRGGIRSSPVITREPTADGFWVHDLLPPTRTMEPHRQVINGNAFNVYVLRRFAAFPLRDGALEIGAMAIDFETGSIFDVFGNNSRQISREGVAVPVEARPLPDPGRPDGPIAVGRWELEARLDRTQVATGDAVTLTVMARGTGNVRDLRLELPVIGGLRALAPQVHDEVTAPSDLVGGTRTWEWLLVSERAGSIVIPAFVLPTYDPANGHYGEVRSTPLTITAAGNPVGSDDTDGASAAAGGADDAPTGAEAPHFGAVRTRSDLEHAAAPVSDAAWYPWALALPPVAWLAFLLFAAGRRRAAARGAAAAPKRALHLAKRRLARAEEHAGQGDPAAFYGEIRQVLSQVLEVRLGEPVGGYTHGQLREHLVAQGMEGDLARRVVDEIEGSEFARFSAAGSSPEEIKSCTERAGALLERLERFQPAPAEVER